MGRYFGTDGVRGVANQELTPELAFRLGLATGTILKENKDADHVIIGMDSRRSGPMLAAALASGLCSAGINVYEGGMLPTPAVAYLARTLPSCAGAVISASHNPAGDNGIKFFGSKGYKLDDATEEAIEALMAAPIEAYNRPTGAGVGWIRPLKDAVDLYVAYLHRQAYCNLKGIKIVLDCANGAASEIAPRVLQEMGAQVISLYDMPDGMNINDGCGSTHMAALQEAVVRHEAHIGLALDGDADRLLAVDSQGRVVDGDQILVLMGLYMQAHQWLGGKVVVTVMSNLGLKKAFEGAKIEVLETKVGDRYVLEKMLETGAWLGGEQSGHIIFTRDGTTGDGLLTALHVLMVLVRTGKPLDVLAQQMVCYPQVLINVRVKSKDGWQIHPEIVRAMKETEKALEDRGRLLVRPSGTEPLLRVMVEGPDQQELEQLAQSLAEVIRQALE